MQTNNPTSPWKDRNFRWLAGGGAISLLGDQFTLLALPWLVLRMSSDTVALGTVLALVGLPRALFILVGGALVDRHSPKSVLMWTKHANTLLLVLLAAGTWTGTLTLPIVYAISLAIGLATAFSIPSATSMLPHTVAPAQLAAANGIMMGLRQASMFAGPLAAGVLIALFGDGAGAIGDARGIALAFAVDACSFALSAWTLAQVRLRAGTQPRGAAEGVWRSIAQVLRHVRGDAQLRTCYLYWAAVAVLVLGPLHIALPVLASSTPALGARALGLMLGAHGAGTLVGMVVAGSRPVRLGTLGMTVLACDVVIGLLFMPLGSVQAAWQGAALLTLIGLLGGSMQVAIFTWLQGRVPPAMIGRAMALFMFIFMGLVPLSSAATGWVLKFASLPQLFMGCGLLLVLLAAVTAVATPMRRVSEVRGAAA